MPVGRSPPSSPLQGFDNEGNPVSRFPPSRGDVVGTPLCPVPEDEVFQSGNTLGWDDNVELPTFFRARGNGNPANPSVDTQFSVPRMEEQIQNALAEINQVKMLTEDDFEGVDADELDSEHLRSMMRDAESLKKKAQGALLILQGEPEGIFSEERRKGAEESKKMLLTFIRTASKTLKSRDGVVNPAPSISGISSIGTGSGNPSREALKTFKADRVRRYSGDTIATLQVVRGEFSNIAARQPCTDAEFRISKDKLKAAAKKSAVLTSEAKTMIEDAVEAGMTDVATTIDALLRQVKDMEWEAETVVNESKVNLGLSETYGGSKAIDYDLKPPIFTGELSELDYFTFRTDFDEYVSVKSLSRSQAVRVLTKTCIQGPTQLACRDFTSVEDVMDYLKTNYGNPRLLLSRRVQDLRELGTCQGTNIKRRDWAVTVRSKLIMLKNLVTKHKLEDELYFSPVIPELQRALPYRLLEDFKEALRKQDEAGNLSRQVMFEKFVEHMDIVVNTLTFEINFSLNVGESEVKTAQKERELQKPTGFRPPQKKAYTTAAPAGAGSVRCYGQGYGMPQEKQCPSCPDKHTHVYYCAVFITTKGAERFKVAAKTRSCFKCLRLDSPLDFNNRTQWELQHQQHCDTSWVCPQQDCLQKDLTRQRHFTMCGRHVVENAQYEEDFVKSLDPKLIPRGTKFFTFFPQLYSVNPSPPIPTAKDQEYNVVPDVENPAIFLLQNVMVNERQLLMFYDSGCMGAAINEYAAAVLDTECVRPGPTFMSVAGAATIEIATGDERFTLLMSDKKSVATLTALRMPEITTPFPTWNLEEVWADVLKEYSGANPSAPPLPPAPRQIGGVPVDIMLGIRYLTHFPELVFNLPCGLGVYRSKFHAPNGETTILGGPHKAWRIADLRSNTMGQRSFLSAEARAYVVETSTLSHVYNFVTSAVEVVEEPELQWMEEVAKPKPVCKHCHCDKHQEEVGWILPVGWGNQEHEKLYPMNPFSFVESEALGASAPYRCVRCRNCADCKKGEVIERISIREEAEQYLIEESVKYMVSKKVLEALLPFIKSPEEHLKDNYNRAYKILETQVRTANRDEQTRLEILASHNKLRVRGHVVEVNELEVEDYKAAQDGSGYHIPWRVVFNEKSLSTPVRIVFDASSITPGGDCLNNILAKGENKLGKLLHILLRFRIYPFAFTCDVSMAYNGIKLNPIHYKFQKYLWKEELNPENPVKVMVVKTLIYGVRPSGNQLMVGFNKLAEHCLKEHPEHAEGARILVNNVYVDDGLKSCRDKLSMESEAQSLVFVLAQAGLGVKSITYSGMPPGAAVSADGLHVGVVGVAWNSEDDTLSTDIKPLFFGKMKRGKSPEVVTGDLKRALCKVFTPRTLWGKVAKVWDPLGLVTPFTSRLKLDLRAVNLLGLSWDDQIPDEYLDTWVRNLSDMEKVKEIKFRRAIIPLNAKEECVSLVTSTDASENIAVACVHTRVRLHGGGYHVQLLTAKSRLVSTNTVPKAELKGAVMGASLSHVARVNLGPVLGRSIYVTDSSIVLYWIKQDQRPLQTGVRNGVIEIHRLTDPDKWFHVDTELNIADLGTRESEVEEMGPASRWQMGTEWMQREEENMPIKTIDEMTLNGEQKRLAAQEMKAADLHGIYVNSLSTKVADRYDFSRYLVDPNKYTWRCVVRVVAYVLKFVRRARPAFSPEWKPPTAPKEMKEQVDAKTVNPVDLDNDDILWGENYFFKKGTEEVKKYCAKREFQNCTVEKGGILYYTSRILDGQDIDDPEGVMLDLQPLSFVKPVLDRFSPISYAIMVHAHGIVTKHRNAACTLRESRSLAYILQGRDLSIEIRDGCVPCRRYRAKLLKAEMGPVHESRLTIAPAFYLVQVDLFGPYAAMCEHNHRSTVKCYGVVFKDPSTSAVAIFMMQNYTTAAFLQAYTRFSSRYGHPAKLFIDAGSQLVKACKDVELSIVDVARDLSTKYQVGVEYETCPVGGHNAHGAVERSIKDIKVLLERVFSGLKLDLISYETCFAWIANELNCFPICIGSRTSNLDHVDLITPSRLLLGRNNRRALGGYAKMESPSRLMDQMELVNQSWWKVWVNEKIVDYIPKSPKWRTTTAQPAIGDIVVFLKLEAEAGFGEPVWRMGRVEKLEFSADGIIRSVVISYKNNAEKVFRTTRRSVRKVAILHHEGDLELTEELNIASKAAGIHYFLRNPQL